MLVNKYVTGNPVPTNEKWRAVPCRSRGWSKDISFGMVMCAETPFVPMSRNLRVGSQKVLLWQSKSQAQILCRQVPAGVLTVQLHASVGGDTVRFFAKSMAGFDLATVAWHVGHRCFLRHVEIEMKLQLMPQNRLYASQVLQFCGPEGIIDRGAVLWPALKMPKPLKSTDAYLKIRHRLWPPLPEEHRQVPAHPQRAAEACVRAECSIVHATRRAIRCVTCALSFGRCGVLKSSKRCLQSAVG